MLQLAVFMNKIKTYGFTLIELLVVVAIIGILASIVMASLSDSREQAKVASAQSQMRSIHTAMEMLFNDTNLYSHKKNKYCPPFDGSNNEVNLALNSSGLIATDGTYNNWSGPYVPEVTDPWGTPYFLDEDYYCTPGAKGCQGHNSTNADHSVLVSCGPDKMIGNDTSNPQPSNGTACAYNDDNIVYVLCKS